jgi:hypothetical protein
VGLGIFTALMLRIEVFWSVMLSSRVIESRRFEGTYCLLPQKVRSLNKHKLRDQLSHKYGKPSAKKNKLVKTDNYTIIVIVSK